MWHLTAYKTSVSLLFLNWIKNEIIFYSSSELMLLIVDDILKFLRKYSLTFHAVWYLMQIIF